MKCFLLTLLCCLLGFKGAVRSEETFVVGTTSAYAPFVSLNEKGEYEGFDIDLANLIAERLNKKLELQDLGSMTSLLVALEKKKIQAIIWAMSITEERQKQMNMIYYQGNPVTKTPFIFWKEIPQGVEKIEDLANRGAICVEAGSYQDGILQKYPSLNVRFLDKITDSLLEIKYGKALTATLDESLLPRMLEQYPEIKVLYLPLPESQQSFGNGICIHKSDQKLAEEVRRIVEDLRSEGKIGELEKKWKLV